MKSLVVLGATGSVGRNTLEVAGRHPERLRVLALTARSDVAGMAALCAAYQPHFAVMGDPDAAQRLEARLGTGGVSVLAGDTALAEVAAHPEADIVLAGIVGAAGLMPTLAAVRAGKKVLLANKEALVMSGALFMDAVRASGGDLVPVDSEHNAVYQCLPSPGRPLAEQGVEALILTASGGPFRDWSAERLASALPDQACDHPNWRMGRKISVDSATLMNKGLEVIEARWLFDAAPEMIRVVVHPQSLVHCLVRMRDGSVLAQMGRPDMRTPIAHALARALDLTDRLEAGVEPLDLAGAGTLTFEAPDTRRFPCLALGYAALERGGTAPAILNAANEIAVAAFLDGRIAFPDIHRTVERALAAVTATDASDLDTVLAADGAGRAAAAAAVPEPRPARRRVQ